jgi:hypothetical protein
VRVQSQQDFDALATREDTMANPFPGMDPYLESDELWPLFHHEFVMSLYQMLLPGLVDRYRARLGQRRYIAEQALFTSVVREEHHEEYIEIRQRGEGRLATLVDVVSPANKLTDAGRKAYLDKRQESKQEGANLVEIDLVLRGAPMIEPGPEEPVRDWHYSVTVTRATRPERHEVWTAMLQKRLPRFRLPLARDDRDTLVDLQAALSQAHEHGDFAAKIDYGRDPAATLTPLDREWVEDALKRKNLRQAGP